jgi:hypothetical protein
VRSSSAPRQRGGLPKDVLMRFFNLPLATGSSEFYRAPSSCLWRHPAGAISFQGHIIRQMATDVGPRWALFGLGARGR